MPGLWCYGALHDTKGLVVNWLPMYCLWVTCGNWSTFRLWLNRLAGFHSIWAWACTVPDWLPAFLVEEGSCIIYFCLAHSWKCIVWSCWWCDQHTHRHCRNVWRPYKVIWGCHFFWGGGHLPSHVLIDWRLIMTTTTGWTILSLECGFWC